MTKMDNPATVMLGPVPSTCKRLILLTWVDPRDRPEDGVRETEGPVNIHLASSHHTLGGICLMPSGGILDVAAEEELADAGVLQQRIGLV